MVWWFRYRHNIIYTKKNAKIIFAHKSVGECMHVYCFVQNTHTQTQKLKTQCLCICVYVHLLVSHIAYKHIYVWFHQLEHLTSSKATAATQRWDDDLLPARRRRGAPPGRFIKYAREKLSGVTPCALLACVSHPCAILASRMHAQSRRVSALGRKHTAHTNTHTRTRAQKYIYIRTHATIQARNSRNTVSVHRIVCSAARWPGDYKLSYTRSCTRHDRLSVEKNIRCSTHTHTHMFVRSVYIDIVICVCTPL